MDMRPAMLQQTVVTSKGDKIARIDAVKKFTHALVEVTSGRALGLVVCADVCRYLLPPTLDRANFLSYIDALVVAPEGASGAWQWPEGQQYLYIGMDAPALATLPVGAQQVIIGEDLHNLADIPELVQGLAPAQRGSA